MPDADHRRNIEIKAKIADEKQFNEKIEIAKQLTGNKQADIIVQHDVFFKVPVGRLKLRYEVTFIDSCNAIKDSQINYNVFLFRATLPSWSSIQETMFQDQNCQSLTFSKYLMVN